MPRDDRPPLMDRLYGSTAAPARQAATPAQTATERALDKLYPTTAKPATPPATGAPRGSITDVELAARWYGGSQAKSLLPTFRRHRHQLFDVGMTAAEIERAEADFAALVQQQQIGARDAETLYGAWSRGKVRLALAPARPEAEVEAEAVAEALRTRETLREAYGVARADALLAQSAAFLSQHPDLAAVAAVVGPSATAAQVLIELAEEAQRRGAMTTPEAPEADTQDDDGAA